MENRSNANIQTTNTKESALHYVAASGNNDILTELLKVRKIGHSR